MRTAGHPGDTVREAAPGAAVLLGSTAPVRPGVTATRRSSTAPDAAAARLSSIVPGHSSTAPELGVSHLLNLGRSGAEAGGKRIRSRRCHHHSNSRHR